MRTHNKKLYKIQNIFLGWIRSGDSLDALGKRSKMSNFYFKIFKRIWKFHPIMETRVLSKDKNKHRFLHQHRQYAMRHANY